MESPTSAHLLAAQHIADRTQLQTQQAQLNCRLAFLLACIAAEEARLAKVQYQQEQIRLTIAQAQFVQPA